MGGFALDDVTTELKNRSSFCGFCKILAEVSVKDDGSKWQAVGFKWDRSILRIGGEPLLVLSIFHNYSSQG